MLAQSMRSILLFAIASPALSAFCQTVNLDKNGPGAVTGARVLAASEAAKFLPDAVFFRGQSARPGCEIPEEFTVMKDELLLVTLVDTAGYSSSVQEKYQAYLITEIPIDVEGHRLEAGAYGCASSLAVPLSSWTLEATIFSTCTSRATQN